MYYNLNTTPNVKVLKIGFYMTNCNKSSIITSSPSEIEDLLPNSSDKGVILSVAKFA